MRRVLARAQKDLAERLEAASARGLDDKTFTIQRLRSTIAQLTAVTQGVTTGIRTVTLTTAHETSEAAVDNTLSYIATAEKQFRGSVQPIRFDEAAIHDEVASGTQASVLRRLMSDEQDPRRPGILERYGTNVVRSFEEELQQRVIQGTPWEEVKSRLVASSPFLQKKPAYWAERIVRIEVMAASNAANLGAIHKADDELGDMVKVLSCTNDNRTGADSLDVHGQIRRLNEAFNTWNGSVMSPPDRPNDRAVVVPHRIVWPIPAGLKPYSRALVIARWMKEGRKGSPPPRPLDSTIPRDQFGAEEDDEDLELE